MSGGSIRYLSEGHVRTIDLDPAIARAAIVEAFKAHGAKRTLSKPKMTLSVSPGHAFQSMCSAWADRGLAGNKWLGTAPVAPGSGLPTVHAVMMLNDHATGRLRAVIDGNELTSIRTAAMSAAAGQFLARPDSRSIGFVGCGVQARAHLKAMTRLLPGLTELHAFSRTRCSAEALVAAGQGLRGWVAETAEAVVRASDVLVTSVPMDAGFKPFLDPAWVRPGAFVSSVDVGRSWMPGLRALDVVAIDDHLQQDAEAVIQAGLGPQGSFDADLAELCAGTARRATATQRTLFVFRGFAIADLAVAAVLLDEAERTGQGMLLPR